MENNKFKLKLDNFLTNGFKNINITCREFNMSRQDFLSKVYKIGGYTIAGANVNYGIIEKLNY